MADFSPTPGSLFKLLIKWVKISGNWSRANPQKSLAFYARKKYGYSEIDYQLFPNSDNDKYQNFILRNSGNDWNYSMFRDALFGEIVAPLDVDSW